MSAPSGWLVERSEGLAGPQQAKAVPDRVVRSVWIHRVTDPALVLGSSQKPGTVDAAAASGAGVEVVLRRSGGGAVLLEPGRSLWIDVLVPAADRLWQDDVVQAAGWLGRTWQGALAGLGVDAEVHEGRLEAGAWGALLCFAGLGPGEVSVGGRKLVGLSQRRTRAGARFQCVVLPQWDPAPTLALLALTDQQRAQAMTDLSPSPHPAPHLAPQPALPVDLAALEAGFLTALPT